jgi:membrane fusion protein (multidrug efflux system)
MFHFPFKVLSIPVVLLAMLLTSCKDNKEDAKAAAAAGKPKGLKAEGYVVIPQSFQNDYTASGNLRANEELEIHPEIAGRITQIAFKEGSFVRKGQLLVQLNDADLRAGLNKLRAQRKLQDKILERSQELVRIGGISRQDYETTETQIASIKADIALQEADLQKTKIVAPFDGVVGLRNVSVGAVVTTATIVALLQQVNPLKMDFTVPEQYYSNIKMGNQVFFTIGNETEARSGTIAAADPGADAMTRSVRIRALVKNDDHQLLAGSFARVRVPIESHPDAILIPSQSIIPTTKDKKVAIVRGGKVEVIVVQLGTRTDDMVEVTQGLQRGDTVITTGIMQVKPGMDVTITKLKT